MRKIFTLFALSLMSFGVFAQDFNGTCLIPDVVFEGIALPENVAFCPDSECQEFSAGYLQTGTTDSYTVEAIDYAPPFNFEGEGLPGIESDDDWSEVQQLPFNFCFFGEVYTQLQVSDNGTITFNPQTPGGFAPYSFGVEIPSPASPVLNAIYGPFFDANVAVPCLTNPITGLPSECGLSIGVLGEYPCRAFVAIWNQVPAFSCGAEAGLISQIVLWEGTNIIEVYVKRKEFCSWLNNEALIGIQNADGTLGYAPPERNTGSWTTQFEAWRFTPAGEPNYERAWYKDGELYLEEDVLEVCYEDVGSTFELRMAYTQCDGEVIEVSKSMTITTVDANLPEDFESCYPDQEVLTTAPFDVATYKWYKNGVEIEGETESSLALDGPGTYRVEVYGDDCYVEDECTVTQAEFATITDFRLDGNTITVLAEGGDDPLQYSLGGVAWQDNPVFPNLESGDHDFYVRTKIGCVSGPFTSAVLFEPNIFTPNGDGKNDYWKIPGISRYPGSTYTVYDRYGRLIHSATIDGSSDNIWDGKINGEPVPSGDYWYMVYLADAEGKHMTGNITVKNRKRKDSND